MTAKEYLGQARFLDMRINSKIQQVASLNELATKCTATISDMPGNPNRGGSRMADAVIKIIDLQEEINRDIDKLSGQFPMRSIRRFLRKGICVLVHGSR